MHIDTELKSISAIRRVARPKAVAAIGPAEALPAHKSLRRILGLLQSVDVRLSLFSFEALPGSISRHVLFSAVKSAVDDSGLAFELEDGRIGALVYGWRPSGAGDDWVESRTLSRLDWALGGPNTAAQIIDIYSTHRPSNEIATDDDAVNSAAHGRTDRTVPGARHRASPVKAGERQIQNVFRQSCA